MADKQAATQFIRAVSQCANMAQACADHGNFGMVADKHKFLICKSCGKPDACIYDGDGGIGTQKHIIRCFGCRTSKDVVTMISDFYGCSLAIAARIVNVEQHLGITDPYNALPLPSLSERHPSASPRASPTVPLPNALRRNPAEIDLIYAVMQGILTPSPSLRTRMKTERFMSDDMIDRYILSPISESFINDLLAELKRQSIDTEKLFGIPGFYRDAHGLPAAVHYPYTDYLIMVYNQFGKRTGIQIRKRPGDKCRYLWFSSASHLDGCSSGTPINYIPSFGIKRYNGIAITEGAFKGLALSQMGIDTLALSSVNATQNVLSTLQHRRTTTVVIAFDMDKSANLAVANATHDLAIQLQKNGLSVYIAEWDSRYKGIDDCVNAGAQQSIHKIPLHSYDWNALISNAT